jgi:hypothetical protein
MSNVNVRGSIRTKELDLNGTWFLRIQTEITNPPLTVDGIVCLDNCRPPRIGRALAEVFRTLTRNQEKAAFKAQPYVHLAQVLRKRGDDDAAREVEAEKMWQEAVERSRSSFLGTLWKIVWWRPYGVMFNYGLSPLRAAISILAIWLLGWGCVSMLSDNQMLQANVTKVASAALVEKEQGVMIVPAETKGVSLPNIACRDAIEPGLYAFELVTPILNLRQESRCAIRSKPDHKNSLKILNRCQPVPEIFTLAPVWEYGEALYMLAGTIITSLALLTFSGIARRWEH